MRNGFRGAGPVARGALAQLSARLNRAPYVMGRQLLVPLLASGALAPVAALRAGPGGAACTKVVPGFAAVSEQEWRTIPPDYGRGTDAGGWAVDRGRSNLAVVDDPAAPSSPPTVMRGRFPRGMPGGRAPFSIALDFPTRYTAVYQCVWIRHSPNFTDNGNVGTKFAFLRGEGTNHYWAFDGGERKDEFRVFVGLQGGAGNRDFRSGWQARPLGVWRRYELLVVGNTPGAANGQLRMWVDGRLILSADDVAYWTRSQTPGWTGLAWEPTYGGGLNPPPYDLYMDVDHWIVRGGSVAPRPARGWRIVSGPGRAR